MDLSKIFLIISLLVVSYLIYITFTSESDSVTNTAERENTADNFGNNNFDYRENLVDDKPIAPEPEHFAEPAPLDEVQNNLVGDEPVEESNAPTEDQEYDPNDVIGVEGTDLLIAAASDRFYSIDTKGQSNRNASNDLRGDIPLPYDENYTPFYSSHIYGEPLVPAGRL
jgi:hypothetical protein